MKTYFNLFATCFLFTLIASFACNKQKFKPNTDLSGSYTIRLNETVNLPIDGKIATLTFTEVKDERCPPNADCISAGSALVTVKFKDRNSEQVKQLCFGTCATVMQIIKSNGIPYYISVKELSYPYITTAYLVAVPISAIIVIEKVR